MVYDIEYGKALLQKADDFLAGKSAVESKVTFISQNRDKAFVGNGARQ